MAAISEQKEGEGSRFYGTTHFYFDARRKTKSTQVDLLRPGRGGTLQLELFELILVAQK